MSTPTRCPTCDTDLAAKMTANGLFGPGIFGTGIDLSALDVDTAWRLGVFFGEQIKAAEERGYVRGCADTIRIAVHAVEAADADEEPRV